MESNKPQPRQRRPLYRAAEIRLGHIDATGDVPLALFAKSASRIPSALAATVLNSTPLIVSRKGRRYVARDAYLLQLAKATLQPKELVPVLIQDECPFQSAPHLLILASRCAVFGLTVTERAILCRELLKLDRTVLSGAFGTWRKSDICQLLRVNPRTFRKAKSK